MCSYRVGRRSRVGIDGVGNGNRVEGGWVDGVAAVEVVDIGSGEIARATALGHDIDLADAGRIEVAARVRRVLHRGLQHGVRRARVRVDDLGRDVCCTTV